MIPSILESPRKRKMSRATRDLVAAFRKIRVIARGLAPIALLSRRPPSRIFRNYSYLDFLRPSLTLSSDAVTVTKTANRQRKSAGNTILKAAVIEDATSKAPSSRSFVARTNASLSVRHATGIRTDVTHSGRSERDMRRPADKDRAIRSETHQRKNVKRGASS